MHPHALVQARLTAILSGEEAERLAVIGEALDPAIPRIVATFYTEMLALEEARGFLDHHVVDTRLRASLAGWLRSLFRPRLVMHGTQILFRAISEEYGRIGANASTTRADLLLVSDVLQYTVVLINESFVRSTLRGEREALSLRESLLAGDLAVECERARAALFDWARQVIDRKLRPEAHDGDSTAIRDSEWGRWLFYRGELLLGGDEVLQELKSRALALEPRADVCPAQKDVHECVDEIQAEVSALPLLLSRLSERAAASARG